MLRRVDSAAPATAAVRLANAALPDLAGLRAHLRERPDYARRVREQDLRTLRALRSRIREVFATAAAGEAEAAVEALNGLLAHSPVVPVVRRRSLQASG